MEEVGIEQGGNAALLYANLFSITEAISNYKNFTLN